MRLILFFHGCNFPSGTNFPYLCERLQCCLWCWYTPWRGRMSWMWLATVWSRYVNSPEILHWLFSGAPPSKLLSSSSIPTGYRVSLGSENASRRNHQLWACTIWAYWCFPLERAMGYWKRFCHGRVVVENQFCFATTLLCSLPAIYQLESTTLQFDEAPKIQKFILQMRQHRYGPSNTGGRLSG